MAKVESANKTNAVVFPVEGAYAVIQLKVFALEGTNPTITVRVTEMTSISSDGVYTADQTPAFTEGLTLRGENSGATGFIILDEEIVAGVAGRITLVNISGVFEPVEPITDDPTIPGKAILQNLGLSAFQLGGEWAVILNSTVDAAAPLKNPLVAAVGDSGERIVNPRKFELRVTAAGTWTKAVFSVQLVQSSGDGDL